MYVHNRIVIQPQKKKEILPQHETAWMDLESIMLNKISQRKTNTGLSHLYVESKQTNELIETEIRFVVTR